MYFFMDTVFSSPYGPIVKCTGHEKRGEIRIHNLYGMDEANKVNKMCKYGYIYAKRLAPNICVLCITYHIVMDRHTNLTELTQYMCHMIM